MTMEGVWDVISGRYRNCSSTCGESDAFVSIPDEGDMVFLRKKVKSGAAVGKLVLLQITGNEITRNEITMNEITGNEITGKQMVVHVGNSSTVDDVLKLEMLFETEGVGHVGKFKEVKYDEVFDDDENIVEDVDVSMNNLCFTTDPKHDINIGVVEVQEDDLDVIDYDSFGSDLDDGIDSERRIQLRELRRIGKHKNKVKTRRKLIMVKHGKERVRVRCQGTIPTLVPYVATQTDMGKNEISQTKGGPVIRDNSISGKQNILGKDKTCQGKGRWEVRTLIEEYNCLQSKEIKACTSKFLSDHIIKSLATNPNITMRAVQDQIQKQFDVGVSKMKAFRAKRIATDKITGSREQYSLLREYAQELINQNPGTTIRIDVQQEPNPESMTRTFRRVCVCLGALKQGFRACSRDILILDECFMSRPWRGQILTAVGVDANNGMYPVAYAIVEVESKASWCWFLSLLGEDLGIEANFNYTFISDRQKAIHENMKSQFKGGRAKCDLPLNNICKVFNRQLLDGKDQPIITCLEYIIEYLMKRIVVVQKVHAAYRLETWAHVYLFKVNLCNGREIWPEVEATTVIAPPLYKPQVGRPPKNRKKSHDEVANESCSSGKLSRKGKSVRCGKCGNMGYNRKGCRGQGGATQAAGARTVSGKGGARRTACARNVSSHASARQAAGARIISSQSGGSSLSHP
ncbi:mutator type transposase, partial [Tanacetum coccineum]